MNNGKTNSKVPIAVVVLSPVLQRFVVSRVRLCGHKHASSCLSARDDFPPAECGPL